MVMCTAHREASPYVDQSGLKKLSRLKNGRAVSVWLPQVCTHDVGGSVGVAVRSRAGECEVVGKLVVGGQQ